MTPSPRRAAIYARVSTLDQEPENQLAELRRYVDARGWTAQEFIDKGIAPCWTVINALSSNNSGVAIPDLLIRTRPPPI